MKEVLRGMALLLVFCLMANAQMAGGPRFDSAAHSMLSNSQESGYFKSVKLQATEDGFVYSTTTHTFLDLVVFSYFDASQFVIVNQAGTRLDSIVLNANQYHVFSPGQGIFSIEGNKSFTVLIGDPVSRSVMGYYAVDESGSPVSTRLNSYMPATSYSGEHFIVFAYNDGTEYYVKNLTDTSGTIAAGVLNKGEHFQLDGFNNKFLGVYANKPVSALSYTDQGYYIPAVNGTFAGNEFYGFSGNVGGWPNGIVITAYEDATDYLAINSLTGDTLMQGQINKGEVASKALNGETYWELFTTGKVTASNTPYAGFAGSYYYLTRQMDESGLGIGTNFYIPVISGDVNIFSYDSNNAITIVNLAGSDTLWSGTLNAGDGYHFYSAKSVYHCTGTGNLAIVSSTGGSFGADFVPLNFAYGLPDLAVSSKDIVFDPESESYMIGEVIDLKATIHNYGYDTATNIRVRFYDGDPQGGNAISPVLTIDALASKEGREVNSSWTVPDYPEYRDIYVAVDFENQIIESNNSNNIAFRSLLPNDDLLPPLAVAIDAPSSVDYESDSLSFTSFSVQVNVFNSGTVDAENVSLKIQLPVELSLMNNADSLVDMGSLPANSTAKYTWPIQIDMLTDDNAYFYSVLVDADNADAKVVEEMLLIKRPTGLEQSTPDYLNPSEFALYANYPNPFNPATTIEYQIPRNSPVQLNIVNILGQKAATLVQETQVQGRYKVQWNASDFPSGIYFCIIQAGTFRQVMKMMYLK